MVSHPVSTIAGTPISVVGPERQVQGPRLLASLAWMAEAGGHRSRVTASPGEHWSVAELIRILEELGLAVELIPSRVRHAFSGRWMWTHSVRVRIGSGPPLVMVAHFDSRAADNAAHAAKTGWTWNTDRAPGADDNASGSAALLELAYVFARTPPKGMSLDLIWSAAEEMAEMGDDGFMKNLGADAVAASYLSQPILGCVAVDMLLSTRPYGAWLRVYSDGGPRTERIVEALREAAWLSSTPMIVDERTEPSFTWSDHGSFWAFGMPGVLVIEDDFHHPQYHRATDDLAAYDEDDHAQLVLATRWLAQAVDIMQNRTANR